MIPTILKGDDTSAYGRTITVNLPEGNLTGMTFYFAFLGIVKDFTIEDANTSHLDIDYTADETRMMPLGTHMATLCAVGSSGTAYTVSNTIPIKVTDNVHECYGTRATTIDIGASGSPFSMPWLDTINANPQTPNELVAAWKSFIEQLKGSGTMLFLAGLLCACLAFGDGLTVQTAPSGTIPYEAPVVTNVTFSGGTDGNAITNIVTNIVDKAYVQGLGIAAEETDPTVAYTNGTYYIKGQRFQALPSNGGLWRNSISVSDRQGAYGGSAVDIEGNFVSVGHAGNQTIYQHGKIVNKGTEINIPEASGTFALEEDLEDFVTTATLSGYVPKTKHELHADVATNICWEVVYSNGWAYLIPYSNRREDAP